MNLAKSLGIEKNVSFRDFYEDQNDVYRLMQASSVFVLPSTREGFGIVVLEQSYSPSKWYSHLGCGANGHVAR